MLGGAGLLAVSDAEARPQQVEPAGTQEKGRGVGPAGFAEQALRSYLSGDAADSGLFATPASGADVELPEEPVAANAVATVRVEPAGPRYWSVLVSVRPSGAKAADSSGNGLRYFQLPISEGWGGGMSAAALPAEVAAPRAGREWELVYGPAQPAGSQPLVKTLNAVFGA